MTCTYQIAAETIKPQDVVQDEDLTIETGLYTGRMEGLSAGSVSSIAKELQQIDAFWKGQSSVVLMGGDGCGAEHAQSPRSRNEPSRENAVQEAEPDHLPEDSSASGGSGNFPNVGTGERTREDNYTNKESKPMGLIYPTSKIKSLNFQKHLI